ncbi:MAG: acyl-CoA/acyl-ACP dehydrogenase, partial [Pseudomonadales bacterium]|nr:acyl-CoA/acyl-ACP dehydrogenase [Pseudomonadales bacterium]
MPELDYGTDYADIREQVARLCAQFPGEYWQRLDDSADYPHEFVDLLTESGFLAALIPEQYGGSGLPIRAASVILETIHANGCSAAACHAQMYTMGTVLRHGNDEQKQKYLPLIASGELRLQAFGVTEPTTGSDTTQLKTRAVKEGDQYVVNGQKIWTSRAHQSDLMLLLARTMPANEVEKRTQGSSTFLVDLRETRGKGCEIRSIPTMINHNTTEVFFDNMRIPVDALVGKEGEGFKNILSGMNAERILIASEALGDGRYFMDKGVGYANERQVFGRPIGQNQGIGFPLATAYTQLEAAEMMIRKAAARYDSGQDCGEAANIAKYLASEAAWKAADETFQTYGGFAFAKEYQIER